MTILCYHAIDPNWPSPLAVRPNDFTEHLRWLAAHRRVLPLDELVDRLDRRFRPPPRTAALTFDDGFATVYEFAFPLLRAMRQPATVFVVTDTLRPGTHGVRWVDDPPGGPLGSLSTAQILEMHESGIRFGSHSRAHRDLTAMSDADCRRDLQESREALEDLLRHTVDMVAYPRGRHDERVRRAAHRAGFRHGFTLPERKEPATRLSVPRVGVYRGNGVHALAVKASRWYPEARAVPVSRAARGLYRRALRDNRGGEEE
jgi:peptidoglycan/xylan/chitin deacetylase (PgdA/CDA1 family)